MKIFIIVMLIAIVASLGSGLYYLSKGDSGSPRVLNALKIRVTLSAVLIAVLVLSYFMGWMAPSTGGS